MNKPGMVQDRWKTAQLVAFVAAAVCLLVYLPALQCDFINYDDPEYVLNNPIIRQLDRETLWRIFSSSHLGWWMPLTWVSLAIDHHFWGINPFGYHLTNILLHAINTGLVVLIADRLLRSVGRGVGGGFTYPLTLLFAGLLFGVHPLRVESVVWVTERKDVLNGLFALGSLLFYIRFAVCKERGGKGGRTGLFYLLSLGCFILSLMAKSVSVVLPVMFLVIDWMPLGRMLRRSPSSLIAEKWPFLAASALMALSTVIFASLSQHLVSYEAFPFSQRVVVSGNALLEYIRILLFPVGLSPFNVIPDPIPAAYAVKAMLAAAGLIWILLVGRVKSPEASACLLCFLLPLLPVLAFFQNGDQSYADRFTYLASVFPSVFIVLYFSKRTGGASTGHQRYAALVAGGVLLALLSGLTIRQQSYWRSTETFWTRIINVEPLAITYKERGRYYHSTGRYEEAAKDFTQALARMTETLKPYAYNLYGYRGESHRRGGRLEEAVADFTEAIAGLPHPAYYQHRGLALQELGRVAEAQEDFRRAGPEPGKIGWFSR